MVLWDAIGRSRKTTVSSAGPLKRLDDMSIRFWIRGYLQGLEIPLGNAAAVAAVTCNPFCSQGWLAGRWLGLSPVGEGFSLGQVAFRLKTPRKCRWLDSPVHGVQPEALGLVASLFGNISRFWKSRQETLQ